MRKHSGLVENSRRLFSISALYHENSKLGPLEAEIELKKPDKSQIGHRTSLCAFKSYLGAKVRFELPDVSDWSGPPFYQVVRERRSAREFDPEPLTHKDLAVLLYYSCGITTLAPGFLRGQAVMEPLRANPSAGALYSLEIYPVLFNVEGVEPGVYHYNVREHSLESVRLGAYQADMWEYSFRQELVQQAAFTFIITAIPARLQWKYGERGYRHILIEAGHLAQNTYLVGTAAGIGVCTIGGFQDDQIARLMFLDGVQEFPVYIVAGGKAPCA